MHRILIVEDEQQVASKLVDAVKAGGWQVAGPVRTLAEARQALRTITVSAAVLDLIAEGEYVYPLARELRTRGIPFAITTGLGQDLDESCAAAPTITKPFQIDHIVETVRTMLDDDGGSQA